MEYYCKLCNSQDIKIILSGLSEKQRNQSEMNFSPTSRDFGIFGDLAQCNDCGIVFSLLDGESMNFQQAYSDSEDEIYLSQVEERSVFYRRILLHLADLIPRHSRVLDLGCSYGIFLKLASERGYETYGVEMSEAACNHCKNVLGLNVFCGRVEAFDYPDSYFDAITALEVIEHLFDPKSFLLCARRLLKPGGIFYLVTPNIKSFSARLLGYKWWSYRRMHIYYFSRQTLFNFLTKNGFSVITGGPYRKTFKVNYILRQLKGAGNNNTVWSFIAMLSRILLLDNRRVTLSFGDIAVTAKKLGNI